MGAEPVLLNLIADRGGNILTGKQMLDINRIKLVLLTTMFASHSNLAFLLNNVTGLTLPQLQQHP